MTTAWKAIIAYIVIVVVVALVGLKTSFAGTLEDVAISPNTFAVCKAADVITTAYVIEHGVGLEANPIVAPLIAHGYIPLILVSYGMYRFIKWVNSPGATLGANIVTCAAAVNNLLLIP